MKNEKFNNDKRNIFTDDAEVDEEQKENEEKILMNECNDKGEEVNKKQEEKINLLEAEIEAFEMIIRILVIG